MALNTFLFCLLVAFIFWVATMGDKAKAAAGAKTQAEPGGIPAMAGGSQALDAATSEATEPKRPA